MKMSIEKIFRQIDALFPTYLSVWEALCTIESPSDSKEGLDAACDYVIALAAERGWEIEVFEDTGKAGKIASITLAPRAKGSLLCLSGHLDTVHPVGLFGYPPTRMEGDRIYGPGVTDCKGGIVAALLAMDALDRAGFSDRPVRLLLQSDEEVGSRYSDRRTINYIIDQSKDAVAFLNLEPAYPGTACIARKGIVTYTFTVNGVEAHTSLCAVAGSNAILEAAHKIIELEKIKDDAGLTCCCSVISGGTVSNTVPGQCVFKANVRYATREQLAYMDDYAKAVSEKVFVKGCTTTFTRSSRGRIMMELCERNLSLLDALNEAFKKAGLSPLEGKKRGGGSDAADVTEAGIPCLDSLGVVGDYIHSADEVAEIESLRQAAMRIASAACFL